MGAKVEEIVNRVIYLTNDPDGDAYPRTAIEDFIHEAETNIVNAKPEALNNIGVLVCVDGARQSISGQFTAAVNFLDAHCNVDNSGVALGAVRRVKMRELDAIRPNWRQAARTTAIREFMVDDREPLILHVNPPASAGARLQISYSSKPAPYGNVDANTQTAVDELYLPMIMDWVMYRMLAKDAEGTPNFTKSQAYRKSFYDSLGIKEAGKEKAGPKNPEHKS